MRMKRTRTVGAQTNLYTLSAKPLLIACEKKVKRVDVLLKLVEPLYAKSNHDPGYERNDDDTNDDRHASAVHRRQEQAAHQAIDESVSNLDT